MPCLPTGIVSLLRSTKDRKRGAGLTVPSGPNGHVPSSVCVDAAVNITSVAEKAILKRSGWVSCSGR